MFYKRALIEELTALFERLNESQSTILFRYLEQDRKDTFARFLKNNKVAVSETDIELIQIEKELSGWELVAYTDHGPGMRGGVCACGRLLRHEFTIENTETGKQITYGKTHLAKFLNITELAISGLIGDLTKTEDELFTLLESNTVNKLNKKRQQYCVTTINKYNRENPKTIIPLPADIQKQVEADLLLFRKQRLKLEYLMEDFENERHSRMIKEQIINKGKMDNVQIVKKNNEILKEDAALTDYLSIDETIIRKVMEHEILLPTEQKVIAIVKKNHLIVEQYKNLKNHFKKGNQDLVAFQKKLAVIVCEADKENELPVSIMKLVNEEVLLNAFDYETLRLLANKTII